MIRQFLLLAIRSSVAYRLCTARIEPRPPVVRRIVPRTRPVPA